MTNFYTERKEAYKKGTPDLRKQSRDHWTKIHKENMESGRNDLIIFSAQILAAYDLADAELKGDLT